MQRAPIVTGSVLERVTRALASDGSLADFEMCARLLAAAPGEAQVEQIVAGLDHGLEGGRLANVPAALDGQVARLWDAGGTRSVVLIRLAARIGSRPAFEAVVRLARDSRAPDDDRIAMIELIGQLARAEDLPVLLDLLAHPGSRGTQLAVLAALGRYQEATIAASLLAAYRSGEPAVRQRILALLCSRPPWARELVAAVARGAVSAKEISPAHAQQIAQLSDPALLGRLEAVWGRVPRTGSPEKMRRIAEVRGLLPEGDKGNAARGKPIFKEHCAVCHKLFDEGETIGPDLTGAERGNLDFLLTSLIDPSALVRKEYQSQTVALRDGRVLTGLIVDENDRLITLVDSNRQKTVIAREAVEAVKSSDVSLMPEGQLDTLTEPQIRDLFRYLQSR